uniref:Beta/gamma crystallin 'Greek key' domain-containing protein n=1 Tax=Oryzias sinensis TaxID=183150 RepID=A0A8C7Z5C3_9TELE
MAKKSSSRNTLKTLFSRRDNGRNAPAHTEDGEQKKSKLLKLRIKAKNSQKATGEDLHAGSTSLPMSPAGPVEVDHIVSLKKSSSVSGTTPRSKGKEFSYSESDLRKPKRFATFSFGLKKRKKKNEETLSKSTFGLDEQESLLDLARRNLDPACSNRQFSSSQPELDSRFDIPSPPPLAKNLSESHIALPGRPSSLLRNRPQSEELLSDCFIEETARAPIASIPELQLSSSEETETCLAVCSTSSSSGASLRQNHVRCHSVTCAVSQVSKATVNPIPGTPDRHNAPGREGSLSPICERDEQNSCLFSPDEVYKALYDSHFPKGLTPIPSTPPTSTDDPAAPRVQTAKHDTAAPRSQDSLRNVTSTEGNPEIRRFSPAEEASTPYLVPNLHIGSFVRLGATPLSGGRPSAAPVSDYVTSQRTRGRVAVPITQAERRLPSPSQVAAPEASRKFLGLLAQMDACDRPLSPAYLSVGSDEGSAADVYYSAQEDNVEESGDEEMFTLSERQDSFLGGGGEEAEANFSGILGMKQEKVKGQRSRNPLQNEGKFLLQHKVETVVQEGGGGGGGGELVAPPVLQVNMTECESAPPSTELTGEGSGSEKKDLSAEEVASLQGPFEMFKQRSSSEDAQTGSVGQKVAEIPSAPPHGELPPLLTAGHNADPETRVLSDTPAESAAGSSPLWAETPDRSATVQRQVPVEVLSSHQGVTEAAERNMEVPDQLDDRFPLEILLTSESEPAAMMSRGNLYTPLSSESSPPPGEDASNHHLYKVTEEMDSGPDFRWKNRFYGVTPYKPSSTEDYLTPSPSGKVAGSNSDSEEWRRSSEWEEPAAPAGKGDEQRQKTAESEQSHRNWEQPELSCSSQEDCSGVFRATLVKLVSDPQAAPESPDTESHIQQDMETLVDTLRSMEPSLKRGSAPPRPQAPTPQHISALPPIEEDRTPDTPPQKPEGNLNILLADLGLGSSSSRDTRSPLELMKSQDLHPPDVNGNGLANRSSRLNSSVLFGSFMSAENDNKLHTSRRSSLPETRPLSGDHFSLGSKEQSEGPATPTGSRLERLSLIVGSSSQTNGGYDLNAPRMSLPFLGSPPYIGSPTHLLSPTNLFSPPSSKDLHWPFAIPDPSMSMLAQNSGVLSGGQAVSQFQRPEPEQNMLSKYRAFPDAYLTKEKEHGKLNPRPGKMFIYDRPGMCGQRWEVLGDVLDASSWELQDTISIRVVRGGWVLYEKPNFKGEKVALDEGDIELSCPFSPPEEPQENGVEENGGEDEPTERTPARRFIIGSMRRAVRDYSVPEISLFPEENAEGKKVVFRDTSEDARIFGLPIKATSIIVNSGLWLVYAEPFFQGVPRVLEVGGYTNPEAWGVEKPYIGSLHPLKVGEPRVENMTEPKMVIFDKPYFTGKSRTITANMRDFISRSDSQQTVFMGSVGSLKVLGGIWVGFQKEGFRGHQYLLEEGEYQDWRVWGGCDSELRSARIIWADLRDPLIVLFEQSEEEEEEDKLENNLEGMEAIPDVELLGFKTSTRSIHVISGAWIAYSHVDFSGNQYILEKGFYSSCADWGAQDSRICSVQPILLASTGKVTKQEIILYSEPDFQGQCHILDQNREALPEKFQTKSCRVSGGSWVLYEEPHFSGNLNVVCEGDYPNLPSMGWPPNFLLRSVKLVPLAFSVPSISLFSLECQEGREIAIDYEVFSLIQEGFNNHVLSVKVNSGCWVICEHSCYRGRQFLLEPIEITNWPKFSSLNTIGSMYPIRQKRHYFRLKNVESGHFLYIQGGVDEMKAGRVVAGPEVEPMSDIWFYQDGQIKNNLATTMSLQVMGNVEPAAKVVLWTETRQPIQTWTAEMRGLISSLTFPGMVLDVKGGKSYDQNHAVMMPENDERPSQQWEIQLL